MRKIAFAAAILFSALSSFGQSTHIGLLGGIAQYQGDLVNGYYIKEFIKPAAGIFVARDLTEHWAVRGGYTFAVVTGSDRFNSKEYLKYRNLNFTSKISEFSVVGEYSVMDLNERKLSPYVFGGLAIYHFNPYTFDSSNNKVFLKPLSTEGQGLPQYPQQKPYPLTQLALPFGAGLRYALTDNIRIGLELGIRKLFTDYLDDVSTNYVSAADLLEARGQQAVDYAWRGDEVPGGNPAYPEKGAQRGGSKQKDLYYLTGLTLSYRLGGGGSGFGGRSKSRLSCPKVPL